MVKANKELWDNRAKDLLKRLPAEKEKKSDEDNLNDLFSDMFDVAKQKYKKMQQSAYDEQQTELKPKDSQSKANELTNGNT